MNGRMFAQLNKFTMAHLKFTFSAFIILMSTICFAQQTKVTGTWKGTSLCQVKSSPCNDEVVVYHITKDSTGYIMQMNKIVGGVEEEMGALNCKLQGDSVLYAESYNAMWTFSFNDSLMNGKLIYKDQLYRIITAKKADH